MKEKRNKRKEDRKKKEEKEIKKGEKKERDEEHLSGCIIGTTARTRRDNRTSHFMEIPGHLYPTRFKTLILTLYHNLQCIKCLTILMV